MTKRTNRHGEERPRRRTSLSRAFFSLLITIVFLAAVAAAAAAVVFSRIVSEGPLKEETAVIIPQGVASRAIAARLEGEGIISSRQVFLAALALDRLRGDARPLRAGEYAIPAGASIRQVIETLRSGKAVVHKLTIPEGFTTAQALERLRKTPGLSGEITLAPAEGSLLPETYVFQRGESRDELIRRMQKAQKKLLDELWPKRAEGLPFRTRREAVILASIVEKETSLPAERPRVAAVFINRLKRGIRLQSDPTIIYGITGGRKLGRPIRKSEIEAKTAWNTYQIDGLPPTPIANPGRASIAAVLNPAKTDDIYFVADGAGGHVFSPTLADHNRNVRRWRALNAVRKARKAQKEAPPPAGADPAASAGAPASASAPASDARPEKKAGGEASGRPSASVRVSAVPLPRPRPKR